MCCCTMSGEKGLGPVSTMTWQVYQRHIDFPLGLAFLAEEHTARTLCMFSCCSAPHVKSYPTVLICQGGHTPLGGVTRQGRAPLLPVETEPQSIHVWP